MYANAEQVHRIICPAVNAWSKYTEILECAKKVIPHNKNVLVLCLLGPTATVLTYDLHKCGYWAIDLGHLDIEYEWFLHGEKYKSAVSYKACNERGGNIPAEPITSEEYERSVIARIL